MRAEPVAVADERIAEGRDRVPVSAEALGDSLVDVFLYFRFKIDKNHRRMCIKQSCTEAVFRYIYSGITPHVASHLNQDVIKNCFIVIVFVSRSKCRNLIETSIRNFNITVQCIGAVIHILDIFLIISA